MERIKSIIGKVVDTIFSLAIYAVIAALVYIIVTGTMRFYDIGYGLFFQKAKDAPGTGVTVEFQIRENMSTMEIGRQLEAEGIIDDARLFWLQEKVSDYAGMILPGTYEISSEMTADEIMAVITNGGEAPAEEETEQSGEETEESTEEGTAASEG